jgi:hypothetical protein
MEQSIYPTRKVKPDSIKIPLSQRGKEEKFNYRARFNPSAAL